MPSSFHVNFTDLQRILANIKIAERDAAGENLLAVITEVATGSPAIAGATFVNAANLPLGLRRVDGSYNHLIPGSPNGVLTGAVDQSFARLVAPSYISATGTASLDLNPGPATLQVSNSSYEPGAPNPQNDPGIHPNSLVDASVRTISNLIVDQTVTNPAAIASALRLAGHQDPDGHALSLYEQARVLLDPAATEQAQAGARMALMDDLAASGVTVSSDGSIVVEHCSADIGLSPANSSWMTIFGQFFDHGLDLLAKGGQGTVYIPLQPDDPLYVEGSSSNFMALTRATGSPGKNLITPWVDQNQTYTSHPSHQVFLREYQRIDRQTGDLLRDPTQPEWEAGLTVATGRLLNGADGGVPTWADVKAHALTYLGIALDDRDVLKIPQVLTDPYGRFIAGQNGYAQLLAVDAAGQSITVEGTAAGLNPTELNAIRIAQAFLDDINRSAVPVIANAELQPDADMAVGGAEPNDRGGFTTYDNELLDAHYVTGDGRGNENIALTAIHSVFHSEHNRVLEANKLMILRSGDLEGINEWLRVPLADDVALSSAQASDADLRALAAGLQWDGERLFQAAKFSTEMQYQHLVFEEFARRIQPNIAPFVFTNSADLDARIVAEFAHTVYRFGHSQLGDGVARLDADLASRDLALIESFLNPLEFANSGLDAEAATGTIARGITRVVDQEIDEFIVEALRNNLLGAPLDLASLNLARGRELGIPSLNETRAQLYAITGAVQLKPYTGWTLDPNQADSHGFFQHLKNPMSVVNLIAAYGTHPAITEATSIDAKRLAAMAIVFNTPLEGSAAPPADALDFLRGTGVYADRETGINAVDLWIGGLAERVNEFGGQLGDTFNAVFQYQMEQLQNGDRFYYLSRTQGMNLLTQLEATTFSDLVMRNSDLGDPHATHLSAHIMGVPDLILELDLKAAQANYSGDGSLDGLVGSTNTAQQRASLDPTSPALFDFLLGGAANSKVMRSYGIEDRNGDGFIDGNVLRFTGGEHVVLGGTEGNDAIYGDKGIDTLWGDGGDDYLNAGMESDQVFGGDGDDIIVDPFGADFLRGEAGDDVIVNGAGLDVDFGGSGQDAMFAVVDTTEMFGGEDNDFMRGGSAPDLLMGGEGDDWMEGGEGFDSMAGDNSELFFNSPIIGHDIMNGQGNDTDYDGENGDDIMVQGVGIQRNNGMEGFDWAIHKGDPVAADTDLTPQIPGLVEIPDAALAVILRDRFDSVEGVSGWKYDDYLRGSVLSIDQNAWFENQLTQAGVDRIRGLRAVLGGVALDDPDAVVFGDLNSNGNSDSQIFLGGDGSDTIMGGVGDDVIDGDAWLNVRLAGVRRDGSSFSVDSLNEIFTDLASGLIDPGEMVAVREILYDDRVDGINPDDVNLDIAVFRDLRENYDIVFDVDGAVTVSHLTVSDDLQSDGIDRLRNIEVVRFADQDLRLVNDSALSSGLLVTTELSTVDLLGLIGASNRVGLAAPVLFDANNVSPDNPLGLVDPDSIVVSFFDAADPATALPLTAAGELELAATSGRQLSMTATYVDAMGFANTFESSIFNTIIATAFANTLTGAADLDYLFGGAGSDVLLGNGGDDYLSGGMDADLLNGGDGIDIANFAGVATSLGNAANPPAQAVVDARFDLNGANLTVSTPTGGLDTLVSIERLRFSDGIFDLVAGATSSADDLTYTGDQRALLFGASGDDNLRGSVDDDIFTYTAAGASDQNAISGGGRDRIDGGANRELGDRLVIQGDNTTEAFRVIAVAGDANAARRAELSAAGFTAIADAAEIVILRGTGDLDALAPLTTASFAVIAEVTAIEELTINVSGVVPTGTQRVQIIGDFIPTSLRANTITITSDGVGAEVDVTNLESVHRVVLDVGTILGQRSQDVVQTMISNPMTPDSPAPVSDPLFTSDGTEVTADGNVSAPLTLRDAQDLLNLVRGIAPASLDPENADAVGVRDLAGAQNNRTNATFGAANEPFIRLTEARFGAVNPVSGIAQVNPIFAGLDPRQISNSVATQQPQTLPSSQANLFWMAFAQYFDHGLDFVVKGGNGTIPIGGVGSDGAENPADLTRAKITGWDADGPQHINQTSPFVDQDQVYGSTALVGQLLRESDGKHGLGSHLMSGGEDPSAPGFKLLPTLRNLLDHHIAAQTIFTGTKHGDVTLTAYYPGLIKDPASDYDPAVIAELNRDFLGSGYSLLVDLNPFVSPLEHVVAGDGRPNENVALSSIHSIWARNHNYHVDQLAELYSQAGLDATPEEIFQAAKIINETEYQRIIFTEFAEVMLGSAGIRGSGEHGFDDYQSGTDARISHEFAAMAYRVGHTMIADDFTILDADGQPVRLPLVDLFLNPTNEAGAFAFDPDGPGSTAPLTGEAALGALASAGYTPVPGYEQLGVARILGGMVLQPAEEVDPQVVDAVRNDLVRLRADLAAFNIARGWDLGLGTLNQVKAGLLASTNPYVQEALSYVGAENMTPYASWDDFQLRNGLADAELERLRSAYPDLHIEATAVASFRQLNPDVQLLIQDDGSAVVSGIDRVDAWVGGLAEQKFEDSLLGSTFWTIIHEQLDRLQEGDRFYYLSRVDDLDFYKGWAKGQSFADIVERNTGLTGLPKDIFEVPDPDVSIGLSATVPADADAGTSTEPGMTDGLVIAPPSDVVGKALHLGLSLHKLPDFTSDDPNELVLRPFGSQAERSAQFYLMLTAESLRDASIDTLDVTFDLGDDFLNIFELSGEQIFFSEDLAVQRRVQLEGSTLRFEGAGLGALGAGHGVSEKAPIAVIALTPREDLDEQIVAERLADRYGFSNSESWQQSLQFSVSANVHEILFSDLMSLGDLGGEAALLTDELQLIARAAQVDLLTDDDFALGTERQVLKPGEDGFSNLIRSGDTLERTTRWRNDGEFILRDLELTDLHQAGVATSKSWIVDGLDALAVGDTAEITTEFHIYGAAGSVLDSAALGFQLDALGGYHWDTADMSQFQQKNLITYQADLNYDGRVSMKDLAFLNAGVSRGYSRDVDANYDGALDINDLAVIDAEWGQSLHQGEGRFLGSDSMSMTDLSHQGMHQWDSSAFMSQNAIEAQQQVLEPLDESAGTLVTVQGFDVLVAQLEQQQTQQYDMV